MNIGDKNLSIINDFLNEVGNQNEFEIRFGKYNFNPATKKSNFESNVEIDYFYHLKNYMTQQNYPTVITDTNEFIFDINGEKIRKTVNLNTNKIDYISKNTKRIYNIYDFDIRLSLASEKTTTISNLNESNANFVRIKKRVTYDLGFANLDFTIVKQGQTLSEANNSYDKFEVEFEIKEKNFQKLINYLIVIMQIRQNNKFIISNIEKRDVFYKYKNLTSTPYFIGAQPETLQKDQLSLLYKELFSVTDKADGDRYFMMINDSGNIYYIDNNIQGILKTNLYSKQYKNTLIDGELIISQTKDMPSSISFHAFDIMFFDGKDLRGDTKYLFKERFDILKSVIETIKEKEPISFYTVQVKRFIYRNVFLGSEIIMDNIDKHPYNNDGLIFTPMNEPYPTTKKWNKLLKWKPADQNTIDFFSIKNGDNWSLYVQGPQETGQSRSAHRDFTKPKSSNLVLFDVNKLCGSEEGKEKVPITFETSFGDNLLDPTTNEPYKTNTVIEYKWVGDKFIPIRTRWDKTANPKKHGNYYQVACSIWNNINNPITSEMLFQMTNGSTPQNESKNGFFFERMNFFNNKIKEYLNNKYLFSEYLLTSKLFESKENFDKTLENLNSEYISTIICDLSCTGKSEYINENNQIMYYIKNLSDDSRIFGKSFKVFINDGHKKSFDINGECILEYKVDYNTLINAMKEYGYECIETESYTNLYENFETMNKVTKHNLLDYEKDITFMYKYCIFKKTSLYNEDKLPVFKNQKVWSKKNDLTNNSFPQLSGLQFYKVENIYNIIDIINCAEYKIYRNMFENKLIDNESILYWNTSKISNYNLLLHDDGSTYENIMPPCIYIYKYEYLTDSEENCHSDYYVVLYNDKIISNENQIHTIKEIISNYNINNINKIDNGDKVEIVDEEVENEIVDKVETVIVDKVENVKVEIVENVIVDNIKRELAACEKLTIAIIKDFLKKLGLKTSGNKEELALRLNMFLNKNE
jgi:hypothetical protein